MVGSDMRGPLRKKTEDILGDFNQYNFSDMKTTFPEVTHLIHASIPFSAVNSDVFVFKSVLTRAMKEGELTCSIKSFISCYF